MSFECAEMEMNIVELFELWNCNIYELSEKEAKLIEVKEEYSEKEQDILTNFDFKGVYGANNEKVRKNHIKKELEDIVFQQNELELSISYLKRYLDFLKHLVEAKNILLKFGADSPLH